MNANLEKSKLEQPEEFTIRHIELDSLKPAVKLLKPKSNLPQQKPFVRHVIMRWKTLGYDHQHPMQNKSGTKIKKPHG